MDLIDLLILFIILISFIVIVYKAHQKHHFIQQDTYIKHYNKHEFKKLDRKLMPIMDHNFNLREIAKQCVLLEEHLNQKNKTCRDCIAKHMITIEGLLEEAISLDKEHTMTLGLQTMLGDWIKIEKEYIRDDKPLEVIGQQVREFRKPILINHFNDIIDYDI